jgi:hypothetical protein
MRLRNIFMQMLCAMALFGCEGVIGGVDEVEPSGIAEPASPHVGVDAGSPQAPTPDAGTPPPSPSCSPVTAPPMAARSLRITDVTINQGVSVPVVENASPVGNRWAPVVADRDGVLRIFVEPQTGWQTRDIVARLTLSGTTREQQIRIDAASSATSLSSTINFALAPGELAENATFSVELLELDPCGTYAGAVSGSRYPNSLTQSLDAVAAPGPFRIVLVPVNYQADGPGLTPNIDTATVARFRERMYGMFPLTDFEVSIRPAPLEFDRSIGSDGAGWSDLLNQCLSLRANDDASPNTYYYCAVRPTIDAGDFCSRGCVAGLGPVPSAGDTFSRAAIGLLYDNGVETFVHETGHTLGLQHAPCGGASGADPEFPYGDGGVGVLGFDVAAQRLVDTEHRDVMGYCSPFWISDYNYDKLYDRLAAVTASSAAALKAGATEIALRPVVIDVDGSLGIGDTVWFDSTPLGESVMVTWVDDAGGSRELTATLVRVSHLPGGIIYVPETANPPATIRIPGYGTATRR